MNFWLGVLVGAGVIIVIVLANYISVARRVRW